MLFDHVGFDVSDSVASKAFCIAGLPPLGVTVTGDGEDCAVVGRPGEGTLWFGSCGGSPGQYTSLSTRRAGKKVESSTPRLLPQAPRTKARLGSGRTITRTAAAPWSSALTDTTSKRSIMRRRPDTSAEARYNGKRTGPRPRLTSNLRPHVNMRHSCRVIEDAQWQQT